MASDKRFNPDELREFLKSKYGTGVHVEVFPKTEQEQSEPQDQTPEKRNRALEFSYKPREIKEYLDRYVIKQDEAKKVLATAVCDHYHHIQRCSTSEDCRDYKKQNILLIGPTGVGKTYLIQNIARLIGVPFVKADATKYSETGYVGGDVEDLIRDLVHQAGGDIQLAEYGIVYLDEIDKIATPTAVVGRDVSGHGVQRGLLKLMEETEVPLRSPTDVASQMQALLEFQSKGKVEKKTISTKHILFVVSGAFTGLSEIIKRRIGSKQIGFMGEKASADQESFLFEKVRSTDFIEYGFEAEFVGRLPVVAHCSALSVDDLFSILKYSEGSLLKQYKKDFLAYDIDAYFRDDAMRAIAERAETERTGARGLMTVCEKVFRDYKYSLPDQQVRGFVVTRETVEDPTASLEELIKNPSRDRSVIVRFHLGKFQQAFKERYGLQVVVSDDGAEAIAQQSAAAGKDPADFSSELFAGYEHGLNLLRQAGVNREFVIDAAAVRDPAGSLERWIKETYK